MKIKKLLRYLAAFLGVSLFVYGLNKSWQISIVISFITISLLFLKDNKSGVRKDAEISLALPEIIDSLISGVHSGLSLVEALTSLSERGPLRTRQYFFDFERDIHSGESFEKSIEELQANFGNRTADQFFEALLLAKTLGGNNLSYLLRQLGDFTRQDLAFRAEVESKQSWVRNSAHIAAVAPWLLLLMLSLQPSTSRTYSTPEGFVVISCGALMTILAYLWMENLSKLPAPKRIFGTHR